MAHNDVSLVQGFIMARAEAGRAFDRPDVYIEKFIEKARHVEVQVLGDNYGKVVSLGERDCSIQRRHQKLLEETPCPALTPDKRKKMCKIAVRAAEKIGYRNAGTIEFLLDEKGNYYFMEMNTRIQVEHPVTEMTTGVDIVKEQIRIAAGNPLSFDQKDIKPRGHSIEWRVNAEDPSNNFAPEPGLIEWVHFPGGPGVRVDTHIYSGYKISPHYDSMLAKIIVHGNNRDEAMDRMSRALAEFLIDGIKTSVPLGKDIINNSVFRRGEYNTAFFENFLKEWQEITDTGFSE